MALIIEPFLNGGINLIKIILLILALLFIGVLVLFCYSTCVISGRCSREEEFRNDKKEFR